VENLFQTSLWEFQVASSWLKQGAPLPYNGAVPLTIRDFQPSDFETVWRIDQECFAPGISYSRAELRHYMRRRGSFTLVAADAKGGIVGFLVAYAGKPGHIITIDVVATTRRSGVGSQLLRAAEERLLAAGSSAVSLETAVDNISALSFYKRHGYDVVKTLPHYYSTGVDALVLRKELGATL
jgi:ribosomal-protein-alanine N-acetyltransferase